ncbi:MAG: Glycosyl transferase family 2 [Candidatus Yanofskybacteria bacterium GW2011_GWE1_40_10]|nr:MAG: Glycosyl transferase family 2 [Candidatus Yanofskybacteria bacterium GW2011_GWE1_40_10]
MDEDYFLYFEDADLSLTAAQAGFSIGIAEGVSINHKVSASTKKLGSPLLLRYHYRNALYFNRKFGPWWVQILLWPWSIWIIKKQIIKLIFGIEKERSQAILNGVFDFYKDKMGKIGN